MKLKTPSRPVSKASPSKGKPSAQPKVAPQPPNNERRNPGSMPTSLAASPLGMSDERKAVYEEANRFNAENGEGTPSPESEEKPPKAEELENAEASPEEEASETSPEEEETKETPEQEEAKRGEELEQENPELEGEEDASEEEHKHTMVPHAALHEERKSHKETKVQLKEAMELVQEAKAQLKVAIDEIGRLKEAPKPEPEASTEEPIDDIEAYSKRLSKRIDDLAEDNRKLREQRAGEAEQRQVEKMGKAVALVDSELMAQGLPGFTKFQALVATRIAKKCNRDPKLLMRWDNPEGWAEIYRTEVYPEMAGVFKMRTKEERIKDKEAMKENANMVSKNGKIPINKEEAKPKSWGLNDYLTHRQKQKIT